MPAAKATSISRKLTWMNLLVSGAALLLACTAFMGYDVLSFRQTVVHNLSTQAQIIGSNSASAILFNDPQSAENTLSALSAAPGILSAVIYTPDGQPLAAYSRDRNRKIPVPPPIPSGQMEIEQRRAREIVLARSIVFQGKAIGVVYIRSDMEELSRRLNLYAGIAAIVLLVSLLAALLVSSIFRSSVAKPIVDLAQIARSVSRDKNYSVRAPPATASSELAVLISAFNDMLDQIDRNERDLRQAHDELEQRVEARTAELRAAKNELEAFSQSVLRAKEELERASKFKDQFLSTMSHELRTPLNAVLGFSDLLTEERYGSLNERQKRYLSHIRTGGKHLLTLINDILDLSKIEAGRLQLAIENVPLRTCFAEVLDNMRPLADKKSQAMTQHAPAGLSIRADRVRFKQVLMNLIGNAIKFTPVNGRIDVVAQRAGDTARIEVRDTGPGIPPGEQRRIFEAFYRLHQSDKAVEGTGLGLAITQRLVEMHGGQLGIESELGAGSCFYFALPAVQTYEEVSEEHGGPPQRRELQTILVVEDDPAAVHLLRSHLSSAGYRVLVCERPEDTLEMAARLNPSAITMDIIMEPVNGWELVSKLKSDPRTSGIPVIMVTIVDQPGTGALLGADEYIVKPVEKATLLAYVERCLKRRAKTDPARPILVVEDDTPTREFVAELLSKNGYEVATAADGAEARARAETSLPEIVILDLILPDTSGFQLMAEWHDNPRMNELSIFVLTSKDLTPEERDYICMHATALFQKQEPWEQALLKQLQRVVQPATVSPS